jgi:hypothetical protein
VALLAAALRAIAGLSPARLEATAEVKRGRLRLTVWARTVAPEGLLGEGPERSERSRVHERDERLVGELVRFAVERLGAPWRAAVRRAERLVSTPDRGRMQLLGPWSVYECRPRGRTVAQRYLAEKRRSLPASDRAWLQAQGRAWLSIWEVRAIDPGVWVEVRDLLTGETRTVHETTASRALVARDAVLARVVDDARESVFCGVHPRPLGPIEADAIVAFARRKLGTRARTIRPARLRRPGASELLLGRWEAAVRRLERRPLPSLANTDGEPILFTADHFAVEPGSGDEVERRIAELEGVAEAERDGDVVRFALVRPGNRLHKSWESTVVGSIALSPSGLKLEANSVTRADDLRRRVERACKGLVRHRAREHSDPLAFLGRAEAAAPTGPPPEDVEGPALRELKQRMYADWLDDPIPVLGGLTPRQAARNPRRRDKLALLLRDLENRESRLPPGERVDVGVLREKLGLPPDT